MFDLVRRHFTDAMDLETIWEGPKTFNPNLVTIQGQVGVSCKGLVHHQLSHRECLWFTRSIPRRHFGIHTLAWPGAHT